MQKYCCKNIEIIDKSGYNRQKQAKAAKAVNLQKKESYPNYMNVHSVELLEGRATFMSDFEILSLMLIFVGIVVGILIEYIKK